MAGSRQAGGESAVGRQWMRVLRQRGDQQLTSAPSATGSNTSAASPVHPRWTPSCPAGLASLAIKDPKGAGDEERRPENTVVPTTATMSRCRCEACRRKVGLLGFACRCGGTYCGAHLHADAHACGFDYKATGREQC